MCEVFQVIWHRSLIPIAIATCIWYIGCSLSPYLPGLILHPNVSPWTWYWMLNVSNYDGLHHRLYLSVCLSVMEDQRKHFDFEAHQHAISLATEC